MKTIKYSEINGKYYVYEQDDDTRQITSVTDTSYARPSDDGIKYVGRVYATEAQARRAVKYYTKRNAI